MAEAARLLDIAGVTKSYGAHEALCGIDLVIGPGELVGLLGPNGAGKSTLFQICAGLFAPDEGQVRLFGLSYRDDPATILSQLGVVFQSRSLDLDMTALANLRFHGGLFGLFGRTLRQRIDEVAGLLGLEPLLDRQVRKLSGGNQRRVEIARALLSRPRLLLLDEPSTGLDPTARRALVTHLRNIVAERQMSILWATHLVEEVENADRILLLIKGKIARQGTPKDLTQQAKAKSLTDAYVEMTGLNKT